MDASKIGPRFYQGADPPHGSELRARGFDVLVLCAAERQAPASAYPGLKVIHAPMDDAHRVPVETAHRAARAVVRELRAGRRVLVCCHAGLNRSGLVTALALWYLTGALGAACMQHVQRARPGALYNSTFAIYLYHLPARGRMHEARAA